MAPNLAHQVAVRFAAATTPDKLNSLLLKVRKKAVSSFNWKNVADVVTHLGGSVTPIVGLVPVQGTFLGKDEAEVAAKRTEVEKLLQTPPANPKTGQFYVTKVDPLEKGNYHWAFDYTGVFANEGWRVSLSGKEYDALPLQGEVGDLQRGWTPKSRSKLPTWDATAWLNKEGGWIDLANKALNMEAVQPSVQRTRDNTGTCGVCFQNIKLNDGRIVLHGYKRPGTGSVHGNCFGTGYQPFELSPEATEKWLKESLIPERKTTKDTLQRLKSGDVSEITLPPLGTWGKPRTIKNSDPTWERELRGQITQVEGRLEDIEADIKIYTDLVQHWKLRDLPKEGEPHINWYTKGRQAFIVQRVASSFESVIDLSARPSMDRIASTRQFKAELNGLVDYVNTANPPSREVLARQLARLANRIAGRQVTSSHTPLYGHNSPDTAYVVDDYPYGFRKRTKIRYWLEMKPSKGFRFMSQTMNPDTGRWNPKPKASTYVGLAAVMYLDEKNHVDWDGLGFYSEASKVLDFVKKYPGADMRILKPYAKEKIEYLFALIEGKTGFTVNGDKVIPTEEDIGRWQDEVEQWHEASSYMH